MDPSVLLVHAHPDDESINNGVTMAACVARGARVTLVTCTRGEEGEIIPAELARLGADREDALGPYRAGELAAAMAGLGVSDHRFLGGQGRWRDSGMMGLASNDRPDAFWRAGLDEAGEVLAEVIREVRPQVLITYDPDGGYGHPDHIQAHRVAMRAAELAAEPAFRRDLGDPHTIDKIYWNCLARSDVEAGFAALREADLTFGGIASAQDLPGVVEDSEVRNGIFAAGPDVVRELLERGARERRVVQPLTHEVRGCSRRAGPGPRTCAGLPLAQGAREQDEPGLDERRGASRAGRHVASRGGVVTPSRWPRACPPARPSRPTNRRIARAVAGRSIRAPATRSRP
jgi:N-acetyl-1-D-myo-inositol-2-amino-2-deoxy-alpha-D-glucopyranoside deacetylase